MNKSLLASVRVTCLLFFMSLISFSTLKAQYYHINESFSGFPTTTNPLPYNGWTQVLTAGDPSFDNWRFYTSSNGCGRSVSSPGSGQYAIFDSDCFSNAGGAENVAMLTPTFDTRGFTNVTLKWDHYLYPYYNCVIYVEVFNGSTWTSIFTAGTSSIAWTTNTYNISSYCANIPNARVRFRFTGDWAYYWMIDNVQIYSTVSANDVAAVSTKMTGGQCGSTSDQVSLTIRNVSSGTLSGIPVKANVTGTIGGNPINSTVSTTYSGSLSPGQFATVTMGSINTGQAGTINVTSFSELGSDPSRTNDTTKVTGISIFGLPSGLSPSNGSRCGAGTVTLNSNATSGNTAIWYNSSSAVSPLAAGNSFTTPLMVPPATATYYVSQATPSTQRTLSTGFSGTSFYGYNTPGGNMFNLVTNNNLIIDSFAVNIYSSSVPVNVSVYYRLGGYAGFETNASAWTLASSTTVNAKGIGTPTYVKLAAPMAIPGGQTYGIYIRSSQELLFSGGSNDYINGDFTLSAGIGVPGQFGGISPAYTWNGTMYYRIYCESNRTSVTATANPAPQNSSFNPQTPFAGTVNAGTLADPDIVASPDLVKYDVLPPTGFSNSAYNTNWTFSSLVMKTKNGSTIPSSDYALTNPSGSTNGYLTVKPSSGYVDSVIVATLTIKRNDNGCDTVIQRVIYNAPRPTSGFLFTNVCLGDPIEFDNKTTVNSSATVTYFWDFGDGTNSNLTSPVKKYATDGTFNVKLIVTTNLGYKDSITKAVTVFALPKPDFKFVNACEGAPITLADNSTLPSGTPSYTWDYGDGSATGSGATSSKQYAHSGIFGVKLSVVVNGCAASVTKYVTQAPRATVAFTSNTGQCDNKTVTFTNGSTAPAFGSVGYQWYFGDGNSGTSMNAEHAYSSFNTYNVTLIATTDMGCKDSVKHAVTLKEAPIPAMTSTGGCTNQDVSFTNGTTVPSGFANGYSWMFGDGNSSTDANPVHQYSVPGQYTITLKATSTNGCEGSKDFFVTIGEKPVAGFSATKVCLGNETEFTNNSFSTGGGALSYDWDLDGTPSTVANPTQMFTTAGNKNISLKVTLGTCSDIITKTVVVAPNPTPNINFVSKHTGDGSIMFVTTDATAGNNYLWEFGDGGSSTMQNPEYKYLGTGVWYVKLTITNADGCSGSVDTTVSANALGINSPVANANLMVYPNPASGIVYVTLKNEGLTFNKVIINDMLGRTVSTISVNISDINAPVQLDLSNLTSGAYMVHFEGVSASEAVKITIVK